MKKLHVILSLLLIQNTAFGHGSHGGGKISIEDDLASGIHLHLPVRIEPSGEILFGYENPFQKDESVEEGEHSDHDSEDHSEEAESHNHSKYHIAPVLVFGGDQISRLISKEEAPENKKFEAQKCDGKTGYILVKNSKLILGAGVELGQHFELAPFGAGLGLVYTKNQTTYSEIHLLDRKEKDRTLKLPGSFQDFSEWRKNEKLSYNSSGSIIFNIGVGIDPVIHGGVIAAASGTWAVKLQKQDEETLQVSVTSVKAVSFGIEVDGTLVGAATEKLKAVEKGLSFSLNMRSPQAVAALKKFYQGDLRSIQKLVSDSTLAKNVITNEGELNGTGQSLSFNLPYLFGAGVSKYKVQSFQSSKSENLDEQVLTSIVSKEENTKGILSNHKKEIEQFSTTFINELHDDHRDLFYAANYKWHYEKDEVKAATVKKKLKDLSIQTGFEELNELNLPQSDLGHFRISLDISFTEYDIFELINFIKADKGQLKNTLDKSIEKTITAGNALDFCPNMQNTETSILNYAQCIEETKFKTASLLKKVKALAEKAEVFVKTKKNKEATKEISQLGFLMARNQFLLKETMANLFDAKITLSIEGENVKRHNFSLR